MSRTNIPDKRVNQFHPGQVWETSRGGLWRVEQIENKQAVFRQGFDGQGRIKRKEWDDVLNWVLYYDPEYDDEIPKEQEKGLTNGNRKKGLQGKYRVERSDGKPLKDGCIVLEWGDPNARKGIEAFARAVREDGYELLAEDLERKLASYVN